LWGLVLSSNFRSYQDFQEKEKILVHNHGDPIETDFWWSTYYFTVRDLVFFRLFSYSRRKKIQYTIVINDIRIELIKIDHSYSNVFEKEKENLTQEPSVQFNNWKRFRTSLNKYYFFHFRKPGELETSAMAYTEYKDDVIFWGFVLSTNFQTYNNFRDNERIHVFNKGIPIRSAKQWQSYYNGTCKVVFSSLFDYSLEEKIPYKTVLNDIKMELIRTNRLHSEIFTTKAENFTPEQRKEWNNWDRLRGSLSTFYSENNYRERKELERVASQLSIPIKSIEDVGEGVNCCRKFVKDGKTYYLKHFGYEEFDKEKGINPKEPFLYKVLEYIGLGPHAEFFIGSSTSYGSSANYLTTNYIMTTGEELHLDTRNEKEFYAAFLDPKNMDHAVEITFAALIQVLLSLKDVFNENLKNYGITTDNRFSFVDHLPGVNGPFDVHIPQIAEAYSPRTHLQNLLKDKQGISNLYNLKSFYNEQFTDQTEKETFNKELNRRVNDRLFNGIREFLSLESAIEKAHEDLKKMINEKSNYFVVDALTRLEEYIKKKLIGKNLTYYKQSNYYKGELKSIEIIFERTLSSQNDNNEKDSSSENQEQIGETMKTSP